MSSIARVMEGCPFVFMAQVRDSLRGQLIGPADVSQILVDVLDEADESVLWSAGYGPAQAATYMTATLQTDAHWNSLSRNREGFNLRVPFEDPSLTDAPGRTLRVEIRVQPTKASGKGRQAITARARIVGLGAA
ncbi:MAG: hypothetical protein KDB35_23115 [Acidimicrobiales bacterium]|nr:hypothetical protein [Acidimicrobiales bacterium]